MNKKYLYILSSIVIIIGLFALLMLSSLNSTEDDIYITIDNNDNIDSVYTKIEQHGRPIQMVGFKLLVYLTNYADNIKAGFFELPRYSPSILVFRKMRNGQQTPFELIIPSVRTKQNLARDISKNMSFSEDEFLQALNDSAICESFGYDTTTIICMFIPNTYEVYVNISVKSFMKRMKRESDKFWTEERISKAKDIPFTPNEVITLASIVDEETANNTEKPMIAGMYINRLKSEMPLQADPTIKFALGNFELKRIYHKYLSINSPYNTYKNIGLPPGPIRIPSIAGIDAVLNYVKHDYMYMCAKEDFSGTHNFAKTYSEHLKNADKYTKALNNLDIK